MRLYFRQIQFFKDKQSTHVTLFICQYTEHREGRQEKQMII